MIVVSLGRPLFLKWLRPFEIWPYILYYIGFTVYAVRIVPEYLNLLIILCVVTIAVFLIFILEDLQYMQEFKCCLGWGCGAGQAERRGRGRRGSSPAGGD